ncbi:uncharacterized protein C6orf118 homolog [Gracilinanus agilis]|uniref:uncharacterized protein C6orf118 homolog n=1 Tax=Gracilinanus agilis TaxID=191870 RepID=UPI001CFE7C5A|nr:uncharacterized protein C6orf118 homolog [Gracilinanus agilis]
MKNSTRINPNEGWKISKLLSELQRVHRDDVSVYTSGHLNPSKLYNPIKHTSFWTGAIGPLRKKTVLKNPFEDTSAKMQDALSEFTINTALVSEAAEHPGFLKILHPQLQGSSLPSLPTSDVALEEKLKEERKKLQTEMFEKDLKLPELRLLKYKQVKNSRQCYNAPLLKDEYQFISTYLSGVTKKDKLAKFMQFQKDVIAKQDLLESDFTGCKVALDHEKKLEQELQKMQANLPPQLNRLKVFGQTFEDVCNSSLLFGDLLKEVKNEYELYVTILMNSQSSSQYKNLMSQVKGMEKRSTLTADIEEARKEVQRLVKVARESLETNEQLRDELKAEELLDQTSATMEEPSVEAVEEKLLTLAEKVEEKRCQILNKWDEIYALEKHIKTDLVHNEIANIAESSCKSIETEAIKLETINGILKKKIMDSEIRIKENLDKHKIIREEQQ